MAAGCRQALRPPTEDDKPPETWITAAPFDTITLDKKGGEPDPTKIPVRFHVYWAGSDEDGTVTGFYWAVTETLATPLPGFIRPPELPGPKPQDYHYTTRTDSTFIFDVAEGVTDRQHAFFIYAVDNKGKADPTPARFIFTATDNFPPYPVFQGSDGQVKYGAYGVGTVYYFDQNGTLAAKQDTTFIQDVDRGPTGGAPRDTVPSNAMLHFGWTGRIRVPGSVITGYAYKLDEPDYVRVPATVTQVEYHTGVGSDVVPLSPGTKLFKIKAIDQAGGTSDSTRRFQLNFSPDTWWAGPDPASPSWSTNWRGEKYFYRPSLGTTGILNTLMSPDSVQIFPAHRAPRKTFLELWNDTLFLRAEYDTVHMNSWAIFYSGGFDRDSPYLVRVSPLAASLPGFPGGPVLTPVSQANGSPIGFRSLVEVLLEPARDQYVANFAQTGLYPLFDPNDVFELKTIASYQPMRFAGKVYVLSKAEDADGSRDQRVDDPRKLVEDVDNGSSTAAEKALRPLVMTFYADRPPILLTSQPGFTPQPGHVFTDLNWNLSLPGFDEDPVDPGQTQVGGRGTTMTLRRRITVAYKDAAGNDTTWTDNIAYINTENITFTITSGDPPAPGPATLLVELCDCTDCETVHGSGRCVTYQIPVVYQPASPPSMSLNRPGSK